MSPSSGGAAVESPLGSRVQTGEEILGEEEEMTGMMRMMQVSGDRGEASVGDEDDETTRMMLRTDSSASIVTTLVTTAVEDVERVEGGGAPKMRRRLVQAREARQHVAMSQPGEASRSSAAAPSIVSREADQPPHTLTALVVMVIMLIYKAFLSQSRVALEEEIRAGLATGASVFLFYCTLQLQDGEVVRPHPVIWRFVQGVIILYLTFVVFLLSQSTTHAVDLTMQVVFEPTSGSAPLPRYEKNDYSENCSLTKENILEKVFDRYFFAHLIGWFVKALILRDWGMMWTLSILFEVMEVTLQKALPNFQECWWDRWILDVFGCNFAGMYFGMKFANWIGAREYDWSGMKVMTRKHRLLQRVIRLATPRIFPQRFEWHSFSSWKRFGTSVLVVIIVLLGDVNGFLLKSALQIPVTSPVHLYRVLFIVPAGYVSVVELYAYAEDRTNRIGRTAWLVLALAIFELLLACKNFWLRQSFTEEQLTMDEQVRMAWIGTSLLGIVVALLKLSRKCTPSLVRLVGRLTIIPLALLLLGDMWEFGGFKNIFKGSRQHNF